jgi:hypothetical protein
VALHSIIFADFVIRATEVPEIAGRYDPTTRRVPPWAVANPNLSRKRLPSRNDRLSRLKRDHYRIAGAPQKVK